MQRLDRIGIAVTNELRKLPAAGQPGHPCRTEIAIGLADQFRADLGPVERLTLATAGMLSLDRDNASELAAAALHDLGAGESAIERERSRQIGQWAAYCASTPRKPVSLTAEERRRAAAINLDADPRAALAEAWAAASPADRRDLVRLASGRAAA